MVKNTTTNAPTAPALEARQQGRARALLTAAVASSAAVSGLGLAHVLEIPGKHALDRGAFLAVHHHLYGGYALVGALGELTGVSTFALAARQLRGLDAAAARLSRYACGALGATLVVYLLGLRSLNTRIASWTPDSMPSDWEQTRDQWELLHAVSFGLGVTAFGAGLRSLTRMVSGTVALRR